MDKSENFLAIGWASQSLVPDRPVLLRGMPSARVGKDVVDPVTVTALAFEAKNGERAILVSADLCGVDENTMASARKALAGLLDDFDPEMMIVNATHTHTSLSGLLGIYPPPPGDCMTPWETIEFMGRKIAETAADAWKKRKRGAAAWGYGHAVVGRNRRVSRHSGESVMYGKTNDPSFSHVEGYEDHGIDLLYTYDDEKRLVGVVINLACPSQCSASLSSISADYWHDVRLAVRQQLGDDLFILPQCSAAGDQSPTILLHKPAEARMLALREGLRGDEELGHNDFNMAQRREIARRISSAVVDVYPLASRDIRTELPFHHQVAKWELPILPISDADREHAERELGKAQKDLAKFDPEKEWTQYSVPYRQVYRYQRLISRHEAQKTKKTKTVEAHIIRLGDIAFATNPFELFLDYGEQIKARSPAIQTFVVQLAGRGSYVPTERAVSGKGYGAEPVSNPVGPEGGKMIVEETLKAIKPLFE